MRYRRLIKEKSRWNMGRYIKHFRVKRTARGNWKKVSDEGKD
jgi:hypothetical protein